MFSQTAIDYAARDPDATLRLYNVLRPRLDAQPGLLACYRTTMATQPLIAAMERTGWRIDIGYLQGLIAEFEVEKAEIQEHITALGYEGLNCNSPPQVAQTLFGDIGLTPSKINKKTRTPSTEDKYLQALLAEHPLVPLICDVRQLVKLQGIIRGILEFTTLGDSFSRAVSGLQTGVAGPRVSSAPVFGRLLPRLNMCGTPTGRLAARDPNLLAIPKHSDRGKRIRKGFLPPEGQELWSWDLSQAELRVLAIDSDDPNLVEAFRQDQDIHEATAQRMFGTSYEREKHRFAAKAVNFGIPMGMSADGLVIQMHKERLLHIGLGDCKAWLDSWHVNAYPTASAFLYGKIDEAEETNYVTCLGGRQRLLPGVNAVSKQVRERARRQAMSFPMQAGAQHIMHTWEAAVYACVVQTGLAVPILQIHDDLVMAGDSHAFDDVDGLMRQLLPQGYNVPIETDGQRGPTWGDIA